MMSLPLYQSDKRRKKEQRNIHYIIKQIDIFFLIKYFSLNYFGNKNDAHEIQVMRVYLIYSWLFYN